MLSLAIHFSFQRKFAERNKVTTLLVCVSCTGQLNAKWNSSYVAMLTVVVLNATCAYYFCFQLIASEPPSKECSASSVATSIYYGPHSARQYSKQLWAQGSIRKLPCPKR